MPPKNEEAKIAEGGQKNDDGKSNKFVFAQQQNEDAKQDDNILKQENDDDMLGDLGKK